MTGGKVTGLDIGYDTARGMIVGRVTGPLVETEQADLVRILTEVVGHARRQGGPLRVMWVNRLGQTPGPVLSEILRRIFVDQGAPGDRMAIVVADSMAKVRSRAQMAKEHQLFASENAALTWLSVGTSAAA